MKRITIFLMAILNVILLSAQTKIPIQEKETTLEVSNNTDCLLMQLSQSAICAFDS